MMKLAKRIAIAALAAAALCGAAWATPVSDHGQLSVKGNRIVDKNGDPVQLRGMSFFWDQWPEGNKFYNSGVVNTLADTWKVSVVRAAYSGTSGNKTATKAVIDAAIAKGIYVIIDWHSHSAHTETSSAESFFKEMANAYKDKPNIIYEIYNEPADNVTWSQIKTYATTIVNAIRTIDSKNIILIGTEKMSKDVGKASKDPVNGTNLAYVAHFYAAQEGHGDEIRTMINVAMSNNQAVFITEMGTCEADGNGRVDTNATNTWFRFLDTHQIGWANWSISDKSESASALNGGASTTGGWSESNYTASGRYIYNKLRFYANSAYTLNVTVSGTGTVTRIPNYTTYTHGTPVTLIAKPGTSGMETSWGGDVGGSGDTVIVSMTANRSVTVAFSPAGNLIKNGNFVSSISPWLVYNDGFESPVPNAKLDFENSEGKITMTAAGTALDHSYIYQRNIALKKGRAYKLTFTARGASARSVTAKIVSGSTALMSPYEVQLTTTKQTFSTTLNMNSADVTDAAVRFCFGGKVANWWITDISLMDVGTATGAAPAAVSPPSRAAWSIAKIGGALQLRGPVEPGARLLLYDTRGKVVRSAAAADGMALSAAGIPAGSYLAVVRNRSGAEVYKARVSFVR